MLAEVKLNTLKALVSQSSKEELIWMNGYLSGLVAQGITLPEEAPAPAAAKAPVGRVTIAYGTETGYVDLDGKRERVPPDKALLKKIADLTSAKAWSADSAKDLRSVYENVKGEVGFEEVRREVTAQWAFYAFAFAVVAALGAVSMAARWPS